MQLDHSSWGKKNPQTTLENQQNAALFSTTLKPAAITDPSAGTAALQRERRQHHLIPLVPAADLQQAYRMIQSSFLHPDTHFSH